MGVLGVAFTDDDIDVVSEVLSEQLCQSVNQFIISRTHLDVWSTEQSSYGGTDDETQTPDAVEHTKGL